jgi:hypothetical protein
VAYTPIIKKEKIKTIIRTTCETIEGMVHKHPRNRLLDTLNLGDEQFIAVCDAKVYSDEDGKLVHDSDFIAVNKSHIISITGDEIRSA